MIQNSEQVDLLQEFFIPPQQFKPFVDFLQSLHPEISKPLMNITIRDVQPDRDSLLCYAPEERIAFVMFFRGPKTVAFERELRTTVLKITDRALALGGGYYLPYRAYQTRQQFSRAYPQQRQFKALIKRYNPQGVFMNQFYKNYLSDIPTPLVTRSLPKSRIITMTTRSNSQNGELMAFCCRTKKLIALSGGGV